MTRRHHRVGPGLWDQPWDDDMRLVAVYVMTCKHRVMEGLFRLPRAYGPADMRWKTARYERAFRALIADGFIQYDDDAQVVWLVNALRWQTPQNPNQVKAAVNALRELPATRLLNEFLAVAVTTSERFAEQLRKQFPQRLGKPKANTPSPSPSTSPLLTQSARGETAGEKPKPRFNGKVVPNIRLTVALAILADLNAQAGTSYRPLGQNGQPTDELKRILGALEADDRLTVELAHQMVANVLAGQHFWEPGPFHPGHVFGKNQRGPQLEHALNAGNGTGLSAAERVALMNREAS